MKIAKKLAIWAENGLISKEQKNTILDFEAARAAGNKWLFFGLLTAACLAVGIGVISIIAYNWADIAPWLKLSVGALILGGLAAAYVKTASSEKDILAHVFLTLFFLGVLGYIGLTAQIFHLNSHPHRGVLFWLAISTPLAFTSKRGFVPLVWAWGMLITIPCELLVYEPVQSFFEWLTKDISYKAGLLGGLAFSAMCAQIIPPLFNKFKNIKWGAQTFFAASLFALTAVFIIFSFFGDGWRFYGRLEPNFYYLLLVAVFLIVGVWRAKSERKILAALALTVFAGTAFYLQAENLGAFFNGAYFLLFAALMAAYFEVRGSKKWCNVFVFIICAKLVAMYAQLSSGLLGFGVSMITSGVVAIALIILWHKYIGAARGWLAQRLSGGAK